MSLAHSAQRFFDSSFGVFQTLVSTLSPFLNRYSQVLISILAKETTFPSLTWATYYAVYIELTCCFIIACLPAIRQLKDKKILPTIRGYTNIISNKYKNSRGGTSSAASPRLVISKTQETRVTSIRFDDWSPDREDSRVSRQVIIE